MQTLLDTNFGAEAEPAHIDSELSETDKDIVEYIAGFVLQRIRRSITRLGDSPVKEQQMMLIKAAIEPDNEHASRLTAAMDRGGLLSATPALMPMFFKLEKLIRCHLRIGEVVPQNAVDCLMTEVFNDTHNTLFSTFEATMQFVDGVPLDLKDKMFSNMIVTYIKTRASGYCKKQIDRLKETSRQGKKERSLRTTLK